MAFVVKDRVKVTTTTSGTGALTLGAAAGGSFQDFSVIGNGNTTSYTVVDPTSGAWEVGIGTYTASGTTLSRDTVLESSNAGALVDFAAGGKEVFVAYPAERAVFTDVVQTLTNKTLNSPTLVTPALGTPASGNLANCTFPTLNQNTTGSAATLTTARTLTIGSTGKTFNGSANVAWTLAEIGASPATAVQTTIYTSGSGTYTVPTGCLYLEVEMVGGGGGGAGSGGSGGAGDGGAGGNGGNTTFHSSNLIAGGGFGASSGNLTGAAGTIGALTGVTNGLGTSGSPGSANGSYNSTLGAFSTGGRGFPTPLGRYGSGGSGGGTGGFTTVPGGAGGSAAWIWAQLNTPAASYSYAVGAAGSAGAAGTNGAAGDSGSGGAIVIKAYF
jgi:hypothetical protein